MTAYQMVPIGAVTHWLSGGTPNRSVSEYWSGDIPWISASTLKHTEIRESDQNLTPDAVARGSKMAPVGSTLLLVRGSALYNEIRAGLVVAPVCFNQDLKALVPRSGLVPKFLTYSLLGRANDLMKLVSTAGNSAGVLDTELVQAFEIFLPLPAEQNAIAEALSDVDGLIAALDKLIAKKRAIKQAAMQQLLTGKTRLPGFSGKWETKRLGEIGHFLKGSGVTRHDANSGRIPCVRYGEIYTTHNDYIRSFHSWISATVAATATPLEYGDILFAGSGETKGEIGKCVAFVTDTEVYAGGDIVILRPRDVNSLFLGYALNTPEVNRQKSSRGQGDAVVHISATALAQVCLLLPPLEEQTAIATVLSDMDAEIEALEARRDKTKQIKQGMMQQLLSGRIRLVQPDPVVRGGEQ